MCALKLAGLKGTVVFGHAQLQKKKNLEIKIAKIARKKNCFSETQNLNHFK